MRYDVRWKQRYFNFSKALAQLTEFIEQPILNKFEVQGLIHCFEYTFKLGWKTIKDYLEQEGFDVKTPRASIQTGFQISLIQDGHAWIDALEKRNLMAHTYNESLAQDAEKLIRGTYFDMLKALHATLENYL